MQRARLASYSFLYTTIVFGCEEPRLRLNQLSDRTERRRVSLRDEDNLGSPFGSRFSTFVFRNVPGTIPERVSNCGLTRNPSNLDKAPKMRDSVLPNSLDSFSIDSAFNLLRNLCDIFLVISGTGHVS